MGALEVDGKPPAHIVIHDIGTPASRLDRACSCSSRERGCVPREALALARDERRERQAGAGSGASSGSSGRTAAIFSARRCCHTVRIIIASVNRKIIDAIT